MKEFTRAKYPVDSPPPRMFRETGLAPSPAYQKPDEGIWEQSYLSKALQNMKDSEVPKLKLLSTSDKPQEYEKWLHLISTTMKGLHPEIGNYWLRVCESAETVYQRYLKDLSHTRVSLLPNEDLARTSIETRIESRLKMMLTNTIPQSILRQCEDKPDVTCSQILYRTIVYAGPASKEDIHRLMDVLTRPKMVELGKLYDGLIQF